ncbi:MAG: beta-lactamase family protein [Bacteroidales bacterium]|nr:beta-lactamase family protein [Bacteroidales bacterium]
MKSLITKLSLFALIVFAFSCKQAGGPAAPEDAGMSSDTLAYAASRMQNYIDEGKLAGIAIMTIKDDIVVQDEALGYADIESNKSLNENTIYRIFSMSKPITAVALMTLYEDEKFELDDKVSDYIPGFAETLVYTPAEEGFTLEPQENPMTIRHLLTHTSGLTYGWEAGSYVDSLYNVTGIINWDAPIGEKVKELAALPLKYQPGTRYEYGLSIDVAGYLVEIFSGMPLDEYMKKEVFEPLKMTDTDFYVPEDKHDRLSSVYTLNKDKQLVPLSGSAGLTDDESVNVNDIFKQAAICFSGGGGLVSTVNDYARFCMMLLNGGELEGNRVLEQETVDLIMSDHLPEGVQYAKGKGYGLGGSVSLEDGSYRWSGAASTSFVVYPGDNMVVVGFTQFMPSARNYFREYDEIVRNSLVNED